MRFEIDRQAWNRGFWDGELGKPLDCCPYAVKAAESLSWLSGYITSKAFRNGFRATPPGSLVPRQNMRPAARWGQSSAPIDRLRPQQLFVWRKQARNAPVANFAPLVLDTAVRHRHSGSQRARHPVSRDLFSLITQPSRRNMN